MTTDKLIHVWETKGLGKAPFRVRGVISLPSTEVAEKNPMAYQSLMAEVCQQSRAMGIGCGTCNVCGTGIMNNFVIESADRKRFVCGCDCVLNSGDAGLISQVDYIKRKAAREKREAARLAKWEADRPAREARQRELQEQARQAELARQEQERVHSERNGWIIDILNRQSGDFCQSMAAELSRRPFGELSDRCQAIIGEIYAKTVGGRKGSKAYDAAYTDFEARTSG